MASHSSKKLALSSLLLSDRSQSPMPPDLPPESRAYSAQIAVEDAIVSEDRFTKHVTYTIRERIYPGV